MIRVDKGQQIRFRFSFSNSGSFYDPLLESPPIDIYAAVYRGLNSAGTVARSEISLLNSTFRIINIVEPTSITDDFFTATFTLDASHSFSITDEIFIYGVGGGYDGSYQIVSIASDTSIQAKKIATTLPNLDDFDSTKYIARVLKKVTNS
jgi:hypothetical protein